MLQRAVADGGHFNTLSDEDDIIRGVPVLLRHGGDRYQRLLAGDDSSRCGIARGRRRIPGASRLKERLPGPAMAASTGFAGLAGRNDAGDCLAFRLGLKLTPCFY